MFLDLNTNQKKAIECALGPTLVIAGPGSGKTHVIINRIHYMINTLKCHPSHILVVTFSKLAAKEMHERFLKNHKDSRVTFSTLHSLFYRILRKNDPNRYSLDHLLGDKERKFILQKLFVELAVEEYEDFIEEFIKHLTLMKNQLINPKYYYPDGISKENFLKLLERYEHYKENNQYFDFDDMLVDCYHLLNHQPRLLTILQDQYRYILVDEFQDINLVQFELLKMLATREQNIFVVGDDDQSIYKFRGAKPEFLLDFKKYFANTQQFLLDINYRSTKNILNYSIALIASNQNRYMKALTTPNLSGIAPQLIYCKDMREQAELIFKIIIDLKNKGVSLSDMAIIYRTNVEARCIVELLLKSVVPFRLRDGMITLYDQWITKDILSYLYLAKNMDNTDLTLSIINKPKRYINKALLEEVRSVKGPVLLNLLHLDTLTEWQKNYIQQLLLDLQNIKDKTLIEAVRYIRKKIGYDQYIQDYASYRKLAASPLLEVLDELEDSTLGFEEMTSWETFLKNMSQQIKEQPHKDMLKDAITLSTMHGAKGLEFDHVFIINVIEGNIPHHKSVHKTDLEEERRLLYVAMTRAKKCLYLSIPSQKYSENVSPSIFITQMFEKYLTQYLKANQWIKHQRFGRGKILKVLNNNIIEVEFSTKHIRKIDSHYCFNNGIIQWEE